MSTGSHSEKSRPAAEAFDAVGVVRPVEPVPGSAAAAAAAAEQNDAGAAQAEGNGEKEGTGTEAEQQEDGEESELPPLWLCGHFAAKPFAKMIDDLRASSAEVPAEGAVEVETEGDGEEEEEAPEPQQRRAVLFWQTKSAVQPLAVRKASKSLSVLSLPNCPMSYPEPVLANHRLSC